MPSRAKSSTSIYLRRPLRQCGFLGGVGSVIDLYGATRGIVAPDVPAGFDEDALQLANDFSVATQDICDIYLLSDSSAT